MTAKVASIAIVPAAGKGSRFGPAPKLTAPIDGVPLLERTIRSLLDGGVGRVVLVVAPGAAFANVPSIADPRVLVAINPDPSRGMLSTIQAGLAAAPADAPLGTILILPADMPFVRPDTVSGVMNACATSGRLVSPVYRGERGHPVALPVALAQVVLAAPPGTTLSDVLREHSPRRDELAVEDPGVLRDVDEPRDLQ